MAVSRERMADLREALRSEGGWWSGRMLTEHLGWGHKIVYHTLDCLEVAGGVEVETRETQTGAQKRAMNAALRGGLEKGKKPHHKYVSITRFYRYVASVDKQEMVREFMDAVGQTGPDHITLEGYPRDLRIKLVLEEALEFVRACGYSASVTVAHNMYFRLEGKPDLVEITDALCDLLYVVYGSAIAAGIDLEPFFKEVHRSNMAKLGPDGKAEYREGGKVKKPEGWTPPDLKRILDELSASRRKE